MFLLKVIWQIFSYRFPRFRKSYNALKQAVAGGQYEFSKGLMFGGKRLEQGPAAYQSFLARRLSQVERVVAIDVHTGLGKSGQDTVLVRPQDEPEINSNFRVRIFSLDPEKGEAYSTTGSADNMIRHVCPRADVCCLVQEFGTVGPIKILHALREENRWHHFGNGSLDHPAKRNLKEAFCRNSDSWRQSVLIRGVELLRQAAKLTFCSQTN